MPSSNQIPSRKRQQRGPSRHRLIFAGIAVIIITAIGISIKPAYRAFRNQRLDKNLELAREAARSEDWPTARDKARSVLLVRNDDFDAFRIWTRAMIEQGEPRAYLAATQWFADRRSNDEDKLHALRVLALHAPQALALGAYGSLPEATRDRADFRAAISPLLVYRGEAEVAEKGLREVMGEDPSPAIILELIRTICVRPDAKRMNEARQMFSRLVARDAGREGLDALLILGNIPGGMAPGEVMPQDLRGWVSRQPKAKTIHHLIALHPTLEANPESKERLFDEAIERFTFTDPGELGTWLHRHKRSEQALALLEEPSKIRADAFLSRVHILMHLKRDDEVKQMLTNPPLSADRVEIEIVLAVMANRGGDASAASNHWTRALNEAAFDTSRNRFLEIVRAAETHRATQAAEDAWVAAIRSGWGRIPLFQDLFPLVGALAAQGRSDDLLAIFRTLSRLEPGNPDVTNNYLYLSLIHRIAAPADVAVRLTEMIQKHPERKELTSALMLAEMMDGRANDALGRVSNVQASPRVAPGMKSLLEGSARILHDRSDSGGAELIRSVRWRDIMPQEQKVFRQLLNQVSEIELILPEIAAQDDLVDPDSVPAWRKAVEKMEQERAGDILPALPPLKALDFETD